MGGNGNTPSSSANGVFDSKSIADLSTEYYSVIYNSVSFEEEEMQLSYGNVCECVKCASNEYCIKILDPWHKVDLCWFH